MPIKILPKDEQTQSESKWISKKKKPKSWITKKEKPKSWITKKEKPKSWITKKATTRSTLTGTDTTRGGGPDSGNVGHNKDMISRHQQYRKQKPEWITKKPKAWITKKAAGGAVTRFRSSGEEGKPHSTKEGRSAEAQRAYIRKFGPQEPRRKRIWPKRAKKAVGGIAKKVGKKFLDFIKTGKHVDKHGVKVNVPKAAERLTGKPHVDHGKRKRIKHLGKGKAEGGRIGLKDGGSVGAAIRGQGAEIK